MIYAGIDPGKSGGIAIIDHDGQITATKMPETISDMLSFWEHYNIGSETSYIQAYVEKVHSHPKNGAKANFTFGYGLGILHTAMTLHKIPFEVVTPQKWMKEFYMKKEKAETNTQWKNRLKQKAQQLFPHMTVTLWNADALLIAEYCRRQYQVLDRKLMTKITPW